MSITRRINKQTLDGSSVSEHFSSLDCDPPSPVSVDTIVVMVEVSFAVETEYFIPVEDNVEEESMAEDIAILGVVFTVVVVGAPTARMRVG